MKKPKIGFIGLGVMGKPMASNLAKAGYHLTVYDIKSVSAEWMSSEFERVRAVKSPKQVALASEIVITMLPDGHHVREVISGKEGLIAGYRPGSLHLDTSSAEPWLTVESAGILEESGVAMVDALCPSERRRTAGKLCGGGGLRDGAETCSALITYM